MARIKGFEEYYESGNVASTTPPLPSHVANDLLLVFACKDDVTGGDSTTASGGWTVGGAGDSPGATTAGCNGSWFYKVATSANESITITNSDSDTWSIIAICIEGADTTTPIDVSDGNGQQETASQAAVLAASSVTTTTNNCLVFYCMCVSTGTAAPFPGIRTISAHDQATEGVAVGMKVQKTSGATGAWNFYAEDHTTANARTFTVAVRDNGSLTNMPAYLNTDHATLITPFRGTSAALRGEAWSGSITNTPYIGQFQFKAVYQQDVSTGTFYDETTDANDAGASDWNLLNNAPVPAANDYTAFCLDYPYIGFRLLYTTAATGGTRVWEYNDGTSWVTLSVTDGTTSFTAVAGTIYNITMTAAQLRTIGVNWLPSTLNGTTGYWLRCVWTTAPTVNPVMTYMRPMYGYTLYDAVGSVADSGANPFFNSSSFTPSAPAQGEWGGTYLTIGTDVTPNTPTNKFLVGTWQFNTARDYVDTSRRSELGGVAITFTDGSGPPYFERTYIIGAYQAKDTPQGDRNLFCIQWSATTKTYPTPLLNDPATISRVGIFAHSLRGTNSIQFSQLVAITAPIVSGGTATNPITNEEFFDTFSIDYYYPIHYYSKGVFSIPVQIGGGDAVFLELNLAQIKFPQRTTEPDAFVEDAYCSYHVDEGALGIIFDARASDVCKITNSVLYGDTRWKFDMLTTCSASATWDFTGTSIINAVVTLRDVGTFTTLNFTICGLITTNGADLINSTINNSTETDGAIIFTSATVGNAVIGIDFIDNNDGDLGHSIEISATGTYTFDAHTFSGGGPAAFSFHTQNDVDAPNDEIDHTAHGYTTGDAIYYQDQTGSDTIGLTDGSLYYVRAITADALAFYPTKADALADTNQVALADGATGQTHYIYSAKADVYNSSGSTVTINVTNLGDIPTIRNSNGSSTTVNYNVTLEVNGVVSGAQCYMVTSGAVVVMNEAASEAVSGNEYKATESYNYTGTTAVTVRAREMGYLPFETTGSITNTGLTVTAVWLVDPNWKLVVSGENISFTNPATITRTNATFVSEGWINTMSQVTVEGSATNDGTYTISAVTTSTLTITGATLTTAGATSGITLTFTRRSLT